LRKKREEKKIWTPNTYILFHQKEEQLRGKEGKSALPLKARLRFLLSHWPPQKKRGKREEKDYLAKIRAAIARGEKGEGGGK